MIITSFQVNSLVNRVQFERFLYRHDLTKTLIFEHLRTTDIYHSYTLATKYPKDLITLGRICEFFEDLNPMFKE